MAIKKDILVDYIISTITTIGIILMASLLAFAVVNELAHIPDNATVTDKDYIPAHNQSSFVVIGSSSHYIPDTHRVTFSCGGWSAWLEVTEEQYDAIELGMNYSQVMELIKG